MNIGEIAKRAGVSRSTVSYALSGKRPVSAATAQRINDVIDELGCRPNASARALAEGRTRTFGLVIPPASTRLTDVQLAFEKPVRQDGVDLEDARREALHGIAHEPVVAGRAQVVVLE